MSFEGFPSNEPPKEPTGPLAESVPSEISVPPEDIALVVEGLKEKQEPTADPAPDFGDFVRGLRNEGV